MKSGIYKITNLVDNKIYIGSTIHFNNRMSAHFSYLRKNEHHSSYLQRAYNKYGKNNFQFEVLLKCPKEDLLAIEQYLIDYYKPAYNMCKIAGRITGLKRSPESIAKSAAGIRGRKLSEEHKLKLHLAHKGKKHSAQAIEKRASKMRGRKVSSEERLRRSLNSTSKKPVLQICPITNKILAEFDSLDSAGKAVGVCGDAIGNVLAGRCRTSGKYCWKYKNIKTHEHNQI